MRVSQILKLAALFLLGSLLVAATKKQAAGNSGRKTVAKHSKTAVKRNSVAAKKAVAPGKSSRQVRRTSKHAPVRYRGARY